MDFRSLVISFAFLTVLPLGVLAQHNLDHPFASYRSPAAASGITIGSTAIAPPAHPIESRFDHPPPGSWPVRQERGPAALNGPVIVFLGGFSGALLGFTWAVLKNLPGVVLGGGPRTSYKRSAGLGAVVGAAGGAALCGVLDCDWSPPRRR